MVNIHPDRHPVRMSDFQICLTQFTIYALYLLSKNGISKMSLGGIFSFVSFGWTLVAKLVNLGLASLVVMTLR